MMKLVENSRGQGCSETQGGGYEVGGGWPHCRAQVGRGGATATPSCRWSTPPRQTLLRHRHSESINSQENSCDWGCVEDWSPLLDWNSFLRDLSPPLLDWDSFLLDLSPPLFDWDSFLRVLSPPLLDWDSFLPDLPSPLLDWNSFLRDLSPPLLDWDSFLRDLSPPLLCRAAVWLDSGEDSKV